MYDPAAMDNARRTYPELSYGTSAMDAAQDADVVVLLTEWAEFREIDPAALAKRGQAHPDRGRPARAGRGHLARGRLGVPGPGPALTVRRPLAARSPPARRLGTTANVAGSRGLGRNHPDMT